MSGLTNSTKTGLMRTIDSQMNPIAWSVDIFKFVLLVSVFTKPSRSSINSGHWP